MGFQSRALVSCGERWPCSETHGCSIPQEMMANSKKQNKKLIQINFPGNKSVQKNQNLS
jgi:hypothetical protein